MLKFFALLSLLVINTVSSRVLINPQSLRIIQSGDDFYQLTWEESHKLESLEDYKNRILPASEWKQIIHKGEPDLAKELLKQLYMYLPKHEFLPYLKLAMTRHENHFNQTVANTAFTLAELVLSEKELEKIKTDRVFRKNLGTQNHWSQLFAHQNIDPVSIDEAIKILNNERIVKDRSSQNLQVLARTSIALAKEEDLLSALIHDSNFEVALSSWVALSRLAPEKYAYEITSEAIWRTESIDYTYGSGCFRSHASLFPGLAAYDLFASYLTRTQLLEILDQDPIINSEEHNNYANMLVSNSFMAKRLTQLLPERNDFINLRHRQKMQEINNSSPRMLAEIIKNDEDVFIGYMKFSQNLFTAFQLLDKNAQDDNTGSLIYSALTTRNNAAKKYIEYLLRDEQLKDKQEEMAYILLHHNFDSSWPKGWSDLRDKALEIYQNANYPENDRRLPLGLRQLLNSKNY